MNCDIFVRAHKESFADLEGCLASIERCCTGFRNVRVVIPQSDRSFLGGLRLPGCKIDIRCSAESGNTPGFQKTAFSPDLFTDAEWICPVEPSWIFGRSTDVGDLFSGDRPRLPIRPVEFANDGQQEATERFLGFPLAHDFSCYPPYVYPSWLYEELRLHCRRLHSLDVEGYLTAVSGGVLSELDALGAFAHRFHPDAMRWMDFGLSGVGACHCARASERERHAAAQVFVSNPASAEVTNSGDGRLREQRGYRTRTRVHFPDGRPVVAMAVHGYHPQIGGSEAHVQWLAEALLKRGNLTPVVLAPRKFGEPRVVAGVDVLPEPTTALACDAVFTYTVSDFTIEVASHLRRTNGLRPLWLHHPCAVEDWGLDLLLDADCVVAMNDRDVELTELLCGAAHKVARVPPGVHPSRRGRPGRFRDRIGADYILWVGAWTAAKGVRSLSERFATFRARYPDPPLKLVMFGGYDGTEWPRAHPDIVTFDRNSEEVPDALADCLLVAFNSAPRPLGYDANPLILLEAFLNGKTFLAQAGTPFLSEIGEVGFVVEDDESWLEAAEILVFDRERRRDLESASHAVYWERYTLVNMASHFEATVLELLLAGSSWTTRQSRGHARVV